MSPQLGPWTKRGLGFRLLLQRPTPTWTADPLSPCTLSLFLSTSERERGARSRMGLPSSLSVLLQHDLPFPRRQAFGFSCLPTALEISSCLCPRVLLCVCNRRKHEFALRPSVHFRYIPSWVRSTCTARSSPEAGQLSGHARPSVAPAAATAFTFSSKQFCESKRLVQTSPQGNPRCVRVCLCASSGSCRPPWPSSSTSQTTPPPEQLRNIAVPAYNPTSLDLTYSAKVRCRRAVFGVLDDNWLPWPIQMLRNAISLMFGACPLPLALGPAGAPRDAYKAFDRQLPSSRPAYRPPQP